VKWYPSFLEDGTEVQAALVRISAGAITVSREFKPCTYATLPHDVRSMTSMFEEGGLRTNVFVNPLDVLATMNALQHQTMKLAKDNEHRTAADQFMSYRQVLWPYVGVDINRPIEAWEDDTLRQSALEQLQTTDAPVLSASIIPMIWKFGTFIALTITGQRGDANGLGTLLAGQEFPYEKRDYQGIAYRVLREHTTMNLDQRTLIRLDQAVRMYRGVPHIEQCFILVLRPRDIPSRQHPINTYFGMNNRKFSPFWINEEQFRSSEVRDWTKGTSRNLEQAFQSAWEHSIDFGPEAVRLQISRSNDRGN